MRFGSRTTDDVTIGKQWFPGGAWRPPSCRRWKRLSRHSRVQDLQRRMIHYAKTRHVKVWIVDESVFTP